MIAFFALINQVDTRLIRISDISATSHAQLIRQTTTKNLGTFLYLLVKSALSHRFVEKRSLADCFGLMALEGLSNGSVHTPHGWEGSSNCSMQTPIGWETDRQKDRYCIDRESSFHSSVYTPNGWGGLSNDSVHTPNG